MKLSNQFYVPPSLLFRESQNMGQGSNSLLSAFVQLINERMVSIIINGWGGADKSKKEHSIAHENCVKSDFSVHK